MTDREAEDLLRKTTGRLCVRYYQRTDGAVMTRNCPVGMAAVRRRLAIGVLSAAALLVAAFGLAVRPAGPGPAVDVPPSDPTYFDKFVNWLTGKPEPQQVMGRRVVMGDIPVPSTPPARGAKP